MFSGVFPKDLLPALRRMQSRDVVLIDTAGQSQYDRIRLEGLKTMIGSNASIDVHLLLNVGTASSEMNETVQRFSPLVFKTYIFTKLDETRMMGNIINQVVNILKPYLMSPPDRAYRKISKWRMEKKYRHCCWKTGMQLLNKSEISEWIKLKG